MARILIIDDDFQIRKMLKITLEKKGHEVEEAENGNDAMDIVRKNPPDLVISDLIMPEKEGIETIMEIRRDFPETKIIAISGGGRIDSQDYLFLAEKLGAQRSLAKPFARKEILELVKELL